MALAVRRVRRFVVPSVHVAGRLKAILGVDPDRIEVVPEGVSGTFLAPLSDAEIETVCERFQVVRGRFAVCIGAISIRKNQLTLIRASAQLSVESFALVLVGSDGYGTEAVEAELARHDRGIRVIRAGYLPERHMAALVQAAATVVHPALAEGFGLVPLEAMAAGTPVIAARSSSIPEVVGDAAVLVDDPTDPSAWATALAGMIDNADRRKTLAAAGRRQAAKFSWQRSAQQMLEVYRAAAA